MNHHDAGVVSYCVTAIERDRYLLPGRCAACRELVFLVLPYGWRTNEGEPHVCEIAA